MLAIAWTLVWVWTVFLGGTYADRRSLECMEMCVITALATRAKRSTTDELPALSSGPNECARAVHELHCFNACPANKLRDNIVRAESEILATYCSKGSDEASAKDFFKNFTKMGGEFEEAVRQKCELVATVEAFCRNVKECVYGTVFEELKEKYPKDVVAMANSVTRLSFAITVSKKSEKLPPSCEFLNELTL